MRGSWHARSAGGPPTVTLGSWDRGDSKAQLGRRQAWTHLNTINTSMLVRATSACTSTPSSLWERQRAWDVAVSRVLANARDGRANPAGREAPLPQAASHNDKCHPDCHHAISLQRRPDQLRGGEGRVRARFATHRRADAPPVDDAPGLQTRSDALPPGCARSSQVGLVPKVRQRLRATRRASVPLNLAQPSGGRGDGRCARPSPVAPRPDIPTQPNLMRL